jgi:ABC-type multidrug transport system fused ATPase/permease subunit
MAMAAHRGPRGMARTKEKRSRPVRILLGRMIAYLGRFKKPVAIGAVFSIVATIVTIFDLPVLTTGVDTAFSSGGTFEAILFLGILYFVLRILAWVFQGLYTWILSGAQSGFVQSIQTDVYSHLVNSDLSYHKSEQSGDVTSRVTSDTEALGTGVQVLIDFSSQALMLVATFIYLWAVSPSIALASLVVVPGIVIIAVLFGTVGQRVMLAAHRAYGRVSGQIAENLSGIHVAKAFNREDELAEDMEELNQQAYKHGFKFMVLMSAMQPLVRSTAQFAIAAILYVGGLLVISPESALTYGQLILGISLVNRFMWPLLTLTMMSTQIQASLAAMDRISDIIEAKPAIADKSDSVSLSPESDGITFEDVFYSYVEGTPVLKDVSFSINAGETVALVGHTGAGKTTVASMINRFYDPDKGRILIGNQDLRDVTLDSLHDAISLIPQEPYLFDDTILENIRYGRPSASNDEIIEICNLIGASDFIEVLADGYETQVFERGKNLSAGQRQMITIARTMLANPRILILDEATSRLDAYSESLVQDAQAQLFSERTTVVIAHRLTTIANASRIIVFDHGEIIEEGSHEELLALGGTFKSLYDTYYAHQGLEEITEDTALRAKEEVSKYGEDQPLPSGPRMSMMMKMMGSGGANPHMMEKLPKEIPPEMLERMMKDPSSVPPEIREKLKKHFEKQRHGKN